ncbi:MAG: metal ABC transporter ATP-binding protein [Limisphaerales bacterium]
MLGFACLLIGAVCHADPSPDGRLKHAPALLVVENLTLDLSGRRILREINLTVAPGEFLGVIGPNGGGKTSMLRVLLGVLQPSAGRVRWTPAADGGHPHIGYVPQRGGTDRNFPLSSREVVKQGRSGARPFFGVAARGLNRRTDELLERVGLAEQADTPFVYLSGGQQRRLLLARSLMDSPTAVLLDEPTAGVDTEGQRKFCAILSELSAQGIAIVLVSHDIPLITRYARRIACLAVTLHWHGAADALEQRTVPDAYRCELERYEVSAKESRAPAAGHPAHEHVHHD